MNKACLGYLRVFSFVWIGCLVIFIGVYLFVLAPQEKILKELKQQIADKSSMYDQHKDMITEKNKVALLKDVEDLAGKVKLFTIRPDETANLALDISQRAKEHKVTAFSMNAVSVKEGQGVIPDCNDIAEVGMTVSFISSFNQFATFVNAMERSRPVVFIDKFNINRNQTDMSGHGSNIGLTVFLKK